ncbi:glycosyltransferase [Kribbella sp. NPDC050124]|uniref:glycosyltransferase n=1 Tax=Kribbella sp. NPDC050124 TaxID=3364114 RepID=UPI0037978A96
MSGLPRNVTVMAHGPDLEERAYRRTKVMLVPSRIETFGRVAVEAMNLGIPVVASTADALVEVLDTGAQFADLQDRGAWLNAVHQLSTDSRLHSEWSNRALQRAQRLQVVSTRQAEELDRVLTGIVAC